MKRVLTILSLLAVFLAGGAGGAAAELLQREDFAGVEPETFAAYPDWPMEDRDFDFGPFSVVGFYDTVAFYMPIAAPVVLPAIGASSATINIVPATEAFGFDLGAASFGETIIDFYGVDDNGGEILLASFGISELMDQGSGPAGYQGFVGFRDDAGREIHKVTIGPFVDFYFDNVYIGLASVPAEAGSWSEVKQLFR